MSELIACWRGAVGTRRSGTPPDSLRHAVPVHTRLVVEYVSALIGSDTPPQVNLVNNVPFRFWYFNAVPFGAITPTSQQYVIAQPMTAFFEAGETPFIGVSGAQVSAAVTVSGYLIDLTQ